MAERFGHWLAGRTCAVLAWLDGWPGWLQCLLVIVVALLTTIVGPMLVRRYREGRWPKMSAEWWRAQQRRKER